MAKPYGDHTDFSDDCGAGRGRINLVAPSLNLTATDGGILRKSRLSSVGNALHQLLAYVHPHVKHVITQTIQQTDAEAPLNPDDEHSTAVNIQRQAVKIQRGDQVEQLTALLPKAEKIR